VVQRRESGQAEQAGGSVAGTRPSSRHRPARCARTCSEPRWSRSYLSSTVWYALLSRMKAMSTPGMLP
jgi:hypothetical protein